MDEEIRALLETQIEKYQQKWVKGWKKMLSKEDYTIMQKYGVIDVVQGARKRAGRYRKKDGRPPHNVSSSYVKMEKWHIAEVGEVWKTPGGDIFNNKNILIGRVDEDGESLHLY